MANFRAKILQYLTDRPGQVVFRSDIADDIGLTSAQVSTCIYNIKKDNLEIGNDIQVVVSGNAWRYVPTPVVAVPTSSETSRSSVNGATRPATTTTTLPVNVAGRRPSSTVKSRLFEEIGESQDGTIIIQESETGALYRATLI